MKDGAKESRVAEAAKTSAGRLGNVVEERIGDERLEAVAARLIYQGLCSVMLCYSSRA